VGNKFRCIRKDADTMGANSARTNNYQLGDVVYITCLLIVTMFLC